MKKWIGLTAGLIMSAALSLTATADDKLKVGFVYIGPVGDHGWSYQHDQGRKVMEKALGDKVSTTFVEKVPDGPDAARAIERLARTGHKLIFTTSFGFMEPTLKVAKRFPDVKFEHATGFKQAKNVATYSSRFYQGRYVIGQIAAKMSKTGVAGYVASFPIPEVVRGINAFMLGAQSVNPDFKLKVVWVNSWFDPGKEADATKVMIGQGADIISQHTDSTAPLQVASEKGIHGFGQATDMIKFAPKAQYTAIIDDWSDYYINRTKAVLDGSWKSTNTWGGMKEEMVKMATLTNLPDDVKKMAEETIAKITSGELNPFGGEITKQDGTKVKEVTEGDLLGMNWYVKGIDNKLQK